MHHASEGNGELLGTMCPQKGQHSHTDGVSTERSRQRGERRRHTVRLMHNSQTETSDRWPAAGLTVNQAGGSLESTLIAPCDLYNVNHTRRANGPVWLLASEAAENNSSSTVTNSPCFCVNVNRFT